MSGSEVYLKIIDIIIKIIFSDSENVFLQKLLQKTILEFYRPYVVSKQSYDYLIKIRDPFPNWLKMDGESRYSEFAREISRKETVFFYTASFYEFENVILEVLNKNQSDSIGLHGAAILFNQQVMIFLGKSGSGKSTIARLLGRKYQILADDILFLRQAKKSFAMYRAPIMEKITVRELSNRPYKIKAFFFLCQSTRFSLKPIMRSEEIFRSLLTNLRTFDHNGQSLKLLSKLSNAPISFFHFWFAQSPRINKFLETSFNLT